MFIHDSPSSTKVYQWFLSIFSSWRTGKIARGIVRCEYWDLSEYQKSCRSSSRSVGVGVTRGTVAQLEVFSLSDELRRCELTSRDSCAGFPSPDRKIFFHRKNISIAPSWLRVVKLKVKHDIFPRPKHSKICLILNILIKFICDN